VRLEMADEVPHDAVEVGELLRLLRQLLRVVLAEVALSRGVRFADRGRGLRLRHRDESHRRRVATACRGGACDPRARLREAGRDHRRLRLRGVACQTITSERGPSGPRSKSPYTARTEKPL